MDARMGAESITTRIGALALPLGIIMLLVGELFHPQREHPMDNPAVFMEYAHSKSWTAVNLVQYFGLLLLLGGLVALYNSVSAKAGWVRGLRRWASRQRWRLLSRSSKLWSCGWHSSKASG